MKSKAHQTIYEIELKILKRCLWTKILIAKSSRESPMQAGTSWQPEQESSARAAGGSSLKLSPQHASLLGGTGGELTLSLPTLGKPSSCTVTTPGPPRDACVSQGVAAGFGYTMRVAFLLGNTCLQEKLCWEPAIRGSYSGGRCGGF